MPVLTGANPDISSGRKSSLAVCWCDVNFTACGDDFCDAVTPMQ